MKRFTCLLAISVSLAVLPSAVGSGVQSGPGPVPALEAYLGIWSTNGDRRRQVFVTSPDGENVEACMMLATPQGWRVMARGIYNQVDGEIEGEFESFGMGFDRMVVVGYPIGGPDDGIDWVNTVTIGDTTAKSYETWSEISRNSYSYVFEIEREGRREYGGAGQYDQIFGETPTCDPA